MGKKSFENPNKHQRIFKHTLTASQFDAELVLAPQLIDCADDPLLLRRIFFADFSGVIVRGSVSGSGDIGLVV